MFLATLLYRYTSFYHRVVCASCACRLPAVCAPLTAQSRPAEQLYHYIQDPKNICAIFLLWIRPTVDATQLTILYSDKEQQSKAQNLDSKYRQMALIGFDT